MKTEEQQEIKILILIAYISYAVNPTRTSLNKLIYFCDVISFLKNKEEVTKIPYQKKQYGPVPQDIDIYRSVLIEKGILKENVYSDGYSTTYVYDISPNSIEPILKLFDKYFNNKEKTIIEDVCKHLGNKKAIELSNITHEMKPWRDSEYFDVLKSSDVDRESLNKLFKEYNIDYEIVVN